MKVRLTYTIQYTSTSLSLKGEVQGALTGDPIEVGTEMLNLLKSLQALEERYKTTKGDEQSNFEN